MASVLDGTAGLEKLKVNSGEEISKNRRGRRTQFRRHHGHHDKWRCSGNLLFS